MRIRRGALAIAAMLLLAACGSSEEAGGAAADTEAPASATSEPAETSDDTAADASAPATSDDDATAGAAAGATVTVASSDLGDILADGEGRTLYLFDNDEPGTSNCSGDCAQTWPPFTGEPDAGDGVDAALLGTIERSDGSTQVTYDEMPLYYFAGDSAAGDTNGQSVGDVWWVVGPDGERITDAAAASSIDSGGY